MIVNLQNEGWEIIYHRAHALLAAQIAGYWDFGENASHRLYETMAAISHHDDLEKEWEDDQLTAAGAPLDFTLERDPQIEQMRRHAADAVYRGRWVALLTSMHLTFLMAPQQDSNPEIARFVKEQWERQAQWRQELNLSKDEAASAYNFMRWCDRLSLILCQRKIPDAGRSLEITTGPDDRSYSIRCLESGQLGVTPWPFKPDTFMVAVDACYLSQLKFDSNAALKTALKNAPRQSLSWTFERP